MPSGRFVSGGFSVAVFFFLASPTLAQEDENAGARLTLRVNNLAHEIKSPEDMNGMTAADSIANLITLEPEEGGVPAAGRTVVKVFATPKEIVVRARCYDHDPAGIVSFTKARDTELDEEDHILIVFDTFLDGRTGYVFAVNPTGARFDGLVIEQGEDVNSDWDTIWEATTAIDDAGWSAEMRIPIKSLGFKKDLTEWGFNVERRVQRLQETSRWSGAKRDYEIFQTSRAGLLTHLPKFDLGMGLSIRPALVGSVAKPGRGAENDYAGDLSFDITQKLGPNLLSALTVNTDFAETEVDIRQVNLTRFPLFFPEKRTFFLEGADIFEFGLGLDEDNLIPFFSRRIGLLGLDEDDQAEIPLNAGGKISGRVGNMNLGALIVNTRQVDSLALGDEGNIHVPLTTMGTLRLKQNILEESSLGMLATFGDQLGRSGSWSAGVDFTYKTSSFRGDKTLLIGIWGLLNNREDLAGDKSAVGLRIDYPNDLFDVNFTSIRLGDGFQPSLGFVPRNNIHLWDFTGDYRPRPAWPLVRQMIHEVSFRLFNNRSNTAWESYRLELQPLGWIFESGERLDGGLLREGDRPREEFEISTDIDIGPGSYEWTRYFLGLRTAEKRSLSAEIKWENGNFYNGHLKTIEAGLRLNPSAFLNVELTAERNTGNVLAPEDASIELFDKDFTEEVFGLRLQLNFSANLQLSSLTQYDTQSREFGANNKLRWTFNPLGDIFIVYNYNMVRRRDPAKRGWEFVSSQLPLKIQYAWRF